MRNKCFWPFLLLHFLASMAWATKDDTVYFGVAIEATMPFIEVVNPLTKPEVKRGILKDLGEALEVELGKKLKVLPLPKTRIAPELVTGGVSMVCYTHENWLPAFKDELLWSNEIYKNTNLVVGLDNIPVPSFESLYGKRVGTIVNFVYPGLEPHFDKNKILRENGPDNESNLRKLLFKRIEYLILSNLEFEYHQRIHAKLRSHDLQLQTLNVKCALSKKAPINLAQLNKAIESLKKRGLLEKIFRSQADSIVDRRR